GANPPASLRRAVAEPTGVATFVASEVVARAATVHWPGFRGANASGIGDGVDTPVAWDLETGDNVLWSAGLEGLGNSSPVVWGDRVFVTTAVAEAIEQTLRTGLTGEGTPVEEAVEHSWRVLAFDKRSGARLWETEVGRGVPLTRRHFKATQANSTPVTNGTHLAVVFPTAGLAVLDLDGNIIWQEELGGLNAGAFSDPGIEWGYASSPTIYQDSLILQVDVHDGPYLAAWDLATGEKRWRVDRDVAPSWATPTLLASEGGDELIVNGSRIHAYDPVTGEELWDLGPNSELVIATPVAGDGVVYVSAGYPPIKPIYAVSAGLRGSIDIEHGVQDDRLLWSRDRGGAYMPTPLLYRGIFYVVHHNGIFVAYDAATGEALAKNRFSSRGAFTSSPVAVNGRLYVTTEEGLLYVLAAGPEYEELAVHDFGEPLMATPAVSEGILLIRTPSKLIALAEVDAPGDEPHEKVDNRVRQ
ncbi:MAG: PQQ-binding-like beta-propeller repeat protein, partial [Acidobacteria bacterium]|nr:PQQ-binding-like beta-propeller repeat protein [Acidobacteriota bacterium]